MCIISVEVVLQGNYILFTCTYRRLGGNLLSKHTDILAFVSTHKHHNITFLGDWDIDLLKHNESSNMREIIYLMYSFSFVPVNTRPTKVTDTYLPHLDLWNRISCI